mgnify:CR=1 FL=1
MSPSASNFKSIVRGFPRVSGDEPHKVIGQGYDSSFSPRERG